jgi:hypothetical protein
MENTLILWATLSANPYARLTPGPQPDTELTVTLNIQPRIAGKEDHAGDFFL